MKNLVSLIIKSLVLLILIQGCKKYEDGPSFTLLSKKARISNKWVVDEILVDDVPTNLGPNLLINYYELSKDGTYTININEDSVTTRNVVGSWEFMNDKEYVVLNLPAYTYWVYYNIDASSRVYKIMRLKNKELWLWQENNSTVETRFEPY